MNFHPAGRFFHFVGRTTLARNLSKGRDVILRIGAPAAKTGTFVTMRQALRRWNSGHLSEF
jgi:hypothetical protein